MDLELYILNLFNGDQVATANEIASTELRDYNFRLRNFDTATYNTKRCPDEILYKVYLEVLEDLSNGEAVLGSRRFAVTYWRWLLVLRLELNKRGI